MSLIITKGLGPDINRIECDLEVAIDTPTVAVDVSDNGLMICDVAINDLVVAVELEDTAIAVDGVGSTIVVVEV